MIKNCCLGSLQKPINDFGKPACFYCWEELSPVNGTMPIHTGPVELYITIPPTATRPIPHLEV